MRSVGEVTRLAASAGGVVTADLGLAARYYQQGPYVQAELTYSHVRVRMEKTRRPDDPGLAGVLRLVASVNLNPGNYFLAEQIENRALSIPEKSLGPGHRETAAARSDLGRICFYQGRNPDAESLYCRAPSIEEKASGTGTILSNLAAPYRSQGNWAEAEPLYLKTLAVSEKRPGPEHPATAAPLNNLAGLYAVQNRFLKVGPPYRRSIAINQRLWGPEHPKAVADLCNLVGLYRNLGHLRKSRTTLSAGGGDSPEGCWHATARICRGSEQRGGPQCPTEQTSRGLPPAKPDRSILSAHVLSFGESR